MDIVVVYHISKYYFVTLYTSCLVKIPQENERKILNVL